MKKTTNVNITIFLELILLFTFSSACIWFNLSNPLIISIIFAIASFILTRIYGFRTCNNRFVEDSIYTIIIVLGLYYTFIYILGLVCGFYNNRYSGSNWFIFIFTNVLEIAVLEFFRYIVISSSKHSKFSMVLISVVLALCDVSDLIRKCNFNDISDSIEVFGLYVIPSLLSSIAFTYICLKTENYKPAMFYRIIIKAAEYFIPIIPNTGLYIQSILNTILPIVLFISFYSIFKKHNKLVLREKKYERITKVFCSILILLMIIFIMLVSSIFKYFIAAVGSGSMEPTINTGDGILVRKLDKDEIKDLNIGDILVYEKYQKIVVHRIVTIIPDENERRFVTKGDHNNDSDNYVISEEEVIGIAIFRIPFIGLPTVWLVNQSNF